MSLRLQRLLIIFLVAYYTLFGGSYYTEHNPPLRVAHQVGTALLFALWLITLWREERPFPATPLDRPLLVYAGVLLASAALSRDARLSLEYTWPLLTHILGFYLLADAIPALLGILGHHLYYMSLDIYSDSIIAGNIRDLITIGVKVLIGAGFIIATRSASKPAIRRNNKAL
jgi:hypothetical protein